MLPSHIIDYFAHNTQPEDIYDFQGHYRSWFKVYSIFSKKLDFTNWWSCIGKGLYGACKAGLSYLYLIASILNNITGRCVSMAARNKVKLIFPNKSIKWT